MIAPHEGHILLSEDVLLPHIPSTLPFNPRKIAMYRGRFRDEIFESTLLRSNLGVQSPIVAWTIGGGNGNKALTDEPWARKLIPRIFEEIKMRTGIAPHHFKFSRFESWFDSLRFGITESSIAMFLEIDAFLATRPDMRLLLIGHSAGATAVEKILRVAEIMHNTFHISLGHWNKVYGILLSHPKTNVPGNYKRSPFIASHILQINNFDDPFQSPGGELGSYLKILARSVHHRLNIRKYDRGELNDPHYTYLESQISQMAQTVQALLAM